MASLNKVFVIGRLTKDPEIRRIPSGTAVSEFSIAVNRYYYDSGGERKEETSFFDVILWAKRAETFAEYVSKGDEVLIEGRLKQERWTTNNDEHRSKIRIIGDNFQFLTKKGQQDKGAAPVPAPIPTEELDSNFDDPGTVPF